MIFGLVPSFFLYRAVYGFLHDQVVWKNLGWSVSSRFYSGSGLKIQALEDLLIYLGFVLFFSYRLNSSENLVGGNGSLDKRFVTFFTQAFNPSTLFIIILVSIIYLPLVFLLGQSINPW